MIKSKVIDILRSLSKEEINRFIEFAGSEFFNRKAHLKKLLSEYKKYHPGFSSPDFSKENVYAKIYPTKSYNDVLFRNLNSDLLSLAESFLSHINIYKNPFILKRHLLSELNERNITNAFEKIFSESKVIVNNYSHNDINFFFDSYLLFLEKDLHNSLLQKYSKTDIENAEMFLLKFFLMKIMEIQYYILYECRVLGIDRKVMIRTRALESFLEKLPKDITESPQVKIYFCALKLEETDDIVYFEKLRKLLQDSGSLIEKKNHYNLYIGMMDFIKRTTSSTDSRRLELFELRKAIVENGLLFENFFPNIFFLNLVKSGLRLGKQEWVESFINEYSGLIFSKYRDSTIDLSFAYLYFHNKDYNQALSRLIKIKYEDTYYNLEVKNLTIRVYYELNQYDIMMSYFDSYRIYLSKNRTIRKDAFTSHNDFLNILKKLIIIRQNNKLHKLENLEMQTELAEFVSKEWITEKIKELSGEMK